MDSSNPPPKKGIFEAVSKEFTSHKKLLASLIFALFGALLLIIVVLAGALLNSNKEKQKTTSVNSEFNISPKKEYENPFSKESQYVNPFSDYKNPFDNL